jgi:hypothetical protein
VDAAMRAFKGVGYHVRREDSDWVLAPDQQALQRELIEGWATAAAETAPEQAPMIGRWLDRRIAHVETGCSRARVRHEEFAAWL